MYCNISFLFSQLALVNGRVSAQIGLKLTKLAQTTIFSTVVAKLIEYGENQVKNQVKIFY